jgi:hypothetical protein
MTNCQSSTGSDMTHTPNTDQRVILMKMIYLIAVAFLCGCGDQTYMRIENECPPGDKALVSFILTCAKNANPLSDEEGEDLVLQCEHTGKRVVCPQKKYFVTYAWDMSEKSREPTK